MARAAARSDVFDSSTIVRSTPGSDRGSALRPVSIQSLWINVRSSFGSDTNSSPSLNLVTALSVVECRTWGWTELLGLDHRVARLVSPQVLVLLAGLLIASSTIPEVWVSRWRTVTAAEISGLTEAEVRHDRRVALQPTRVDQLRQGGRGEQLGDRDRVSILLPTPHAPPARPNAPSQRAVAPSVTRTTPGKPPQTSRSLAAASGVRGPSARACRGSIGRHRRASGAPAPGPHLRAKTRPRAVATDQPDSESALVFALTAQSNHLVVQPRAYDGQPCSPFVPVPPTRSCWPRSAQRQWPSTRFRARPKARSAATTR